LMTHEGYQIVNTTYAVAKERSCAAVANRALPA
jgi:hypothetical protein